MRCGHFKARFKARFNTVFWANPFARRKAFDASFGHASHQPHTCAQPSAKPFCQPGNQPSCNPNIGLKFRRRHSWPLRQGGATAQARTCAGAPAPPQSAH